jgi:hypothetical protein
VQRRLGSTIDASDPSSISYIESLKLRIRDLEGRCKRQSDVRHDDLNSNDSTTQSWSSDSTRADTPRAPSNGGTGTSVVYNRPGDDLRNAMHEANYLSLSAMAEPTDRQSFSNQELSFSTLFVAAASVGGANPSIPSGTNQSVSGSIADFRGQIFPYGSRFDADQAVEAFQTFLGTAPATFPSITRGDLEELYNTVSTAERDGVLEIISSESPDKVLLVRTGIALGMLLSPTYSFTEVLASELASKAVQLMPRILDQSEDLAVVQCLTALTVYSLYTTYGGSSWHLLGLAMTRCISSGMHTSRISDMTSESEIKRQNGRAFWTLYVLDTHLSTAMDRPFCLNDSDIMMSPPSSPRTAPMDTGFTALQHLIQHAQILRSIRNRSEDDLLCHFVNLSHWKETIPAALSAAGSTKNQLHVRGLVELLKCPLMAQDVHRDMMLRHIEGELAGYAAATEHQLTSHQRAPGALEGYLIFSIGAFSASQPPDEGRQRCVLQCLSSLTMISMRYTAFQGFRSILVAFQSRSASREQLQALMSASEIAVSPQLQQLILGNL